MATFAAPGRLEIMRELERLTEQKAANLAAIATLTAQNDTIDLQIAVGQDTLDFIASELDQAEVTGFSVTSSGPNQAEAIWDDMGAGKTYNIERAFEPDYSDAVNVYTGGYASMFTDSAVADSGVTVYYRINSTEFGKDDSDWVNDSIVIT